METTKFIFQFAQCVRRLALKNFVFYGKLSWVQGGWYENSLCCDF